LEKRKRVLSKAATRLIWRLSPLIPKAIRSRVIRKVFKRPRYDETLNLSFRRAETEEEFEGAFRLVYESYRELGLINENQTNLRVTKYHALPTTAVLIAEHASEVIATLTVVVDSSLGIPCDSQWNLAEIRQSHVRVAEVTSLAIAKPWRTRRGAILLPLCKFMRHYAEQILAVDALVAVTHPKVAAFYEDVLLFQRVPRARASSYRHVKGAPGFPQYLSLGGLGNRRFRQTFNHLPEAENIYQFLYEPAWPNFHMPKNVRESDLAANQFQSAGLLETLFRRKSDVVDQLSEQEKTALFSRYFHRRYFDVFALDRSGLDTNASGQKYERRSARFMAQISARIRSVKASSDERSMQGLALEVSREGLCVRDVVQSQIQQRGEGISVEITLPGHGAPISLEGHVAWVDQKFGRVGVKLASNSDVSWRSYIERLERSLLADTEYSTISHSALRSVPSGIGKKERG
jgi:hypothetical protein